MKTKFVAIGKLKKCPSCGNAGELGSIDYGGFLRDDEYQVKCTSCEAHTDWISSPESAVQLWNAREIIK